VDESPAADGRGDEDKRRRRRRLSRVFAWVRNIGIVVVLFAAWQVWGTAVAEHHSQTQLSSQFDKDATATPPDDRPAGLIDSTTNVATAPEGTVVAQIQIPAIGVRQFVVEGTSTSDLEKGPGHNVGTAVPGQAGNVAIAGHRTTFGAPFNRLHELRPGEQITLTTTAGERLTYAVSGAPRIVSPSDVAILRDFGDDRLTLSTSDPKYAGAHELVVVALLRHPSPTAPSGSGATAAPAPTVGPPPGKLVDMHTAAWNPDRLPPVVLVVVLLVLLGLVYRRPQRGRRLLAVVILGPIWIVGLYLLFAAVTNLLPATL
jgi:sortase A